MIHLDIIKEAFAFIPFLIKDWTSQLSIAMNLSMI